MAYQEYQVIRGDASGRDITGWTVMADSLEDAREVAKKEQDRGGGVGSIDVRGPLIDICELCGLRHRAPPAHLGPDSYCRD